MSNRKPKRVKQRKQHPAMPQKVNGRLQKLDGWSYHPTKGFRKSSYKFTYIWNGAGLFPNSAFQA